LETITVNKSSLSMQKSAVLALSGGMDSTALLVHLLANDYEVKAFSFDYGQKHKIELELVKKNILFLQSQGLPVSHQIIDIRAVFDDSVSSLVDATLDIPHGHYQEESMKSTVVENRNAVFAAILYSKALAWSGRTGNDVRICLGIHQGDHAIYPDCTAESRDALEYAFKISNWGSEKVSYYTPYIETDKAGILKDLVNAAKKLELSFEGILKNTNTCYSPTQTGAACGKCGSCQERLEAFGLLGLKDPVAYVGQE
jgi:7-cyano-7-deazaguanine synthase